MLHIVPLSIHTHQDLKALHDVHQLCFERSWSEAFWTSLLQQKNVSGFCLRHKDICGVIVWQDGGQSWDVLTLAVHPAWQKKGWGGKLLLAMIEKAQTGICREIFLEVKNNNDQALSLYQKKSFKIVGLRPGYYSEKYEKNQDALVLLCTIH